ncbi:MAG: alpha/beta hydrolase [Beijerinckiaceae bacterium]
MRHRLPDRSAMLQDRHPTSGSPATAPRRLRRALVLGGVAVGALAHGVAACAPAAVFNTVVGVEPGGRKVRTDVAYGSQPRQRYDVYAPEGARNAPVAIFFFGGSWSGGRKEEYSFIGRTLAARGFLTVIPNYRIVPEVTFPVFVEDGAAAVAHVRAQAAALGGDPRRIFFFGHSAGAYIAAMLGASPDFLPRAGVPRSAIRAIAGIAGPYDFLPFDVKATQDAFGTYSRPRDTQPVLVADAATPPMLLLHGADDTTVLPRNSVRLAARLKALGRPVETKLYPGLGHVGIITAVTRTFSGQAPVTDDLVDYFNRQGAGALRVARAG